MPYCLLPGSDIRVFKTSDLNHIANISNDPEDKEHVSVYFYNNQHVYNVRKMKNEMNLVTESIRLAVDYQEDFNLVRKIFETLYPNKPNFSMLDVFNLWNSNSELRKINNDKFS